MPLGCWPYARQQENNWINWVTDPTSGSTPCPGGRTGADKQLPHLDRCCQRSQVCPGAGGREWPVSLGWSGRALKTWPHPRIWKSKHKKSRTERPTGWRGQGLLRKGCESLPLCLLWRQGGGGRWGGRGPAVTAKELRRASWNRWRGSSAHFKKTTSGGVGCRGAAVRTWDGLTGTWGSVVDSTRRRGRKGPWDASETQWLGSVDEASIQPGQFFPDAKLEEGNAGLRWCGRRARAKRRNLIHTFDLQRNRWILGETLKCPDIITMNWVNIRTDQEFVRKSGTKFYWS